MLLPMDTGVRVASRCGSETTSGLCGELPGPSLFPRGRPSPSVRCLRIKHSKSLQVLVCSLFFNYKELIRVQ